MQGFKQSELLLARETTELQEATRASIPGLQEQLEAIEELEEILAPEASTDRFVVATSSTGH